MIGEMIGSGWLEIGEGSPVRRALGGISSDQQVVAPVRGVGEAPETMAMRRPLLLHGVEQIWD